jgi:hypothetical protein
MTNTGTSQGPSLRKSASVGDWSVNAKTMVSFLILDLYRFLKWVTSVYLLCLQIYMLFFSFCLGSDAVGIFLFPEARLLASCSRENTQLCVTGILLLQSTSHQRKELCNNSVSASILIPHLQNLVKQTAFQQVCHKLNILLSIHLSIVCIM